MGHSVGGRRCLSLFPTMVPAVPAPRTTRVLMVVVMLRRYPHGYQERCEPPDRTTVRCETKACLTVDFADIAVSRRSGALEPPTEEPRDEREEHVGHPRRRQQCRHEDAQDDRPVAAERRQEVGQREARREEGDPDDA